MKEIDTLCKEPDKARFLRELYYLPGVRYTRANLYYRSGIRTLMDFAASQPEEIIAKTEELIRKENLDLKAPLMKEVKQ